ncbi:MAG TPA: UDP-2,3-diacylglucosamine diphosphatase [Symbiobacteriaceae bacterium]
MADQVIYFVSDTHLGDGSGADRFRYPVQLMSLLGRIETEPGAHLVLLGDFLELWACSLEGVLVRHAPIFDAIGRIAATHPVTYVVGNHDCLPWYYYLNQGLGQVRVVERFTAARDTIVAVHGHQYDPLNQVTVTPDGHVKAPWAKKLVQVIGFIERAGDGLLLQRVKAVLERESPGERNYPEGESIYEDAARALMRSGARSVVMGHTHHPLTRRYGNRVYVNTGSWVWDRYPPTYGRLAGGRLELLNGNTHQPFEAS